jgi:hypothetical protein
MADMLWAFAGLFVAGRIAYALTGSFLMAAAFGALGAAFGASDGRPPLYRALIVAAALAAAAHAFFLGIGTVLTQ